MSRWPIGRRLKWLNREIEDLAERIDASASHEYFLGPTRTGGRGLRPKARLARPVGRCDETWRVGDRENWYRAESGRPIGQRLP